jgi:hypothetical protein
MKSAQQATHDTPGTIRGARQKSSRPGDQRADRSGVIDNRRSTLAIPRLGAAIIAIAGLSFAGATLMAQPPTLKLAADGFQDHPAAAIFLRFYNDVQQSRAMSTFRPSRITRQDYLLLIESNVDFWKQHQNAAGAIIDPYESKERQYSTPAFALASAILVTERHRDDLLDASIRAMTFATEALAKHTTADRHADFYIPMLMHARRLLKDRASPSTLSQWDQQFRSLVPEACYRSTKGTGNWNLVNISGECLRRKDGLVAPDQMDAQMAYIERCLASQQTDFTAPGMYQDPNSPLAYDAFARLWLEDALADMSYDGKLQDSIAAWLRRGGLSSLLLISPSGEWACGGRSAHHQWNEAELAVICEIEASRWKAAGRSDVAGSFKRAAHLALESMYRWRRPSGELWIVKNFADPKERFGFEGYSFNSQYNNLPMAMLAMAYLRADDSIVETPMPSEAGAYVFDLREIFHKVIAAAGGVYVEIDTGADPGYNATGLQRVHKSGVALSPLSDSTAGHRHIAPTLKDAPALSISPGIQWQETSAPTTASSTGADDGFRSLADFNLGALNGIARPYGPGIVLGADLRILNPPSAPNDTVSFLIRYALDGDGAEPLEEQYTVSAKGVELVSRLTGKAPVRRTRLIFPALVNDGKADTQVSVDGSRLSIARKGGKLSCQVVSPEGVSLRLDPGRFPNHNGRVQPAIADLPKGAREVRMMISLSPDDQATR